MYSEMQPPQSWKESVITVLFKKRDASPLDMFSADFIQAIRVVAFVTAFPQALPALAAWQADALHPVAAGPSEPELQPARVPELVVEVAAVLRAVGDAVPTTKLAEALGPRAESVGGLVQALRDLSRCEHKDNMRASRLRGLSGLLATAGEGMPIGVLRSVAKAKFDLLLALEPDHLARLMETKEVEWSSLREWASCARSASPPTHGGAQASAAALDHSSNTLTFGCTGGATTDFWQRGGSVIEQAPSASIGFHGPAFTKPRVEESVTASTFADLRDQYEPINPKRLEEEWPSLKGFTSQYIWGCLHV